METDCELSANHWKLKLIGLSADVASVNTGSHSGVAKRLCDLSHHLLSVHFCAHRVELAIRNVETAVPFFKPLEDTLLELYKLYKWPLCWSGLQEAGRMLQINVSKPTKP